MSDTTVPQNLLFDNLEHTMYNRFYSQRIIILKEWELTVKGLHNQQVRKRVVNIRYIIAAHINNRIGKR